MQAIILAAGNSSRMFPYAGKQHKSEIYIFGKMLIEHTILSLAQSGIKDILIVITPHSTIRERLGNGEAYGVSITYAIQGKPLGMGDAVLSAREQLQENFFVLNGYHVNVSEFLGDMMHKQGSSIVLLAKKDTVKDHYGNIVLENDKVLQVREKPEKSLKTDHRLVGIYLLNKQFISLLSSLPTTDFQFEEALDRYAKQFDARCVVTKKATISLKYPWDLLYVKDFFLKRIEKTKIASTAEIGKNVVMDGNVIVKEGATIHEGVVIKGPCYIGKNAVVGNNAVLRDNVCVEADCLVGATMETKNTLFMQGAHTHSGFIGDSIIGMEAKIAGDFCTANARLDRGNVQAIVKEEKIDTYLTRLGVTLGNHCNVGIRVSTMPGIIVGNNVTIGPSTTVMKNIPSDVTYYTKFAEVVQKHNQ
ncbi:MAG TPA: NDP-sugar synthase [Patescibacteria group bacterium]|nr:NDP-sugar synthase [Patescibacteria group bacterium]